MTSVSEKDIRAALKTIETPANKDGQSALDLLSGLAVDGGHVRLSLEVDPKQGPVLEDFRLEVERAIFALEGVTKVSAMLTAERSPQPAPPFQTQAQAQPPRAKRRIEGVAHIVAVASGKGGVGKSTVSFNLALALARRGLKVGVLDADIYGPSLPRLSGIHGRASTRRGKIMVPMEGFGLKLMSMGFLVDPEAPTIWRGPMLQKALMQMLFQVDWGALDLLIVDMPPGTGDVQITISQQVHLEGAVVVSTPQELALIDAVKGIEMFRKVDVPILGLIENMSAFIAPDTGARYDIFGAGGVRDLSGKRHIPVLGEVPLTLALREGSDNGQPAALTSPDGVEAKTFESIAGKLSGALGLQVETRQ